MVFFRVAKAAIHMQLIKLKGFNNENFIMLIILCRMRGCDLKALNNVQKLKLIEDMFLLIPTGLL